MPQIPIAISIRPFHPPAPRLRARTTPDDESPPSEPRPRSSPPPPHRPSVRPSVHPPPTLPTSEPPLPIPSPPPSRTHSRTQQAPRRHHPIRAPTSPIRVSHLPHAPTSNTRRASIQITTTPLASPRMASVSQCRSAVLPHVLTHRVGRTMYIPATRTAPSSQKYFHAALSDKTPHRQPNGPLHPIAHTGVHSSTTRSPSPTNEGR